MSLVLLGLPNLSGEPFLKGSQVTIKGHQNTAGMRVPLNIALQFLYPVHYLLAFYLRLLTQIQEQLLHSEVADGAVLQVGVHTSDPHQNTAGTAYSRPLRTSAGDSSPGSLPLRPW